MPSLGELKRRRTKVRRRKQKATSARKHVRKVGVPKGAKPAKKKLLARLAHLAGRLRERAQKLTQRIKRKREERNKRINTSPGWPHWGGSAAIIDREVLPVAKQFGVPLTSRKRPPSHPLSISNPGSDHNEANTLSDAADLGTFSGEKLAHAIARALGIEGYSTGNYNGYTIYRDGHAYRVQILWAVKGHYDHVHVGIKRIS